MSENQRDECVPDILIYGAYGYTGKLVVAEAIRRGLRPKVAGRDPVRTAALAALYGLEWVAVSLDDEPGLDRALTDCAVVAHCAGPFAQTAAPMVQACLRTGTHYLDLTGEAEVFDAIYARHDDAVHAGIALVPGAGFDVVPTDHLIATLSDRMPDAVRAEVAMVSNGGFSAGTLQTALLGVVHGNRVRRSGVIEARRLCHRRLEIRLPNGTEATVASTPLGDLASGPRAVPRLREVTTFTVVPAARAARVLDAPLRAALHRPAVAGGVQRLLARVPDPTAARMNSTRSAGWVRLFNTAGEHVTLAVEVPNTYAFTAASMVHAAYRLPSRAVAGALAPSTALGADFITTIPGVDLMYLDNGVRRPQVRTAAKHPE